MESREIIQEMKQGEEVQKTRLGGILITSAPGGSSFMYPRFDNGKQDRSLNKKIPTCPYFRP